MSAGSSKHPIPRHSSPVGLRWVKESVCLNSMGNSDGGGVGLKTTSYLETRLSTMVSSGLQTFLLYILIKKVFEHTTMLCVYLCLYKLYTYIRSTIIKHISNVKLK